MRKLLVLFLVCIMMIGGIFVETANGDEFHEEEPCINTFLLDTSASEGLDKPALVETAAAITMDTVSGRVLYEKNAYSKRAIASTTKIMTCIVALEKGNLEDVVTVSKKAANTWGSSIKLKTGEKLTLKELLYGLMVKSGNDAAVAVAEHIGGSVEGFAAMMNEKAKEIGAENSQFKTPHGLDKEGHYSTAYDLALIARYALDNPTFSKIVGTKNTFITGRELNNTNEMLSLYPGADGVKTGYTGMAGRCLVTSATRNQWRIISVVLGCPSRTQRAEASKKILDYSFKNYQTHLLLEANKKIADIPVIKGVKTHVPAISAEEIKLPLRNDEIEKMEKKVYLRKSLNAPVWANIEVGRIEYLVEGKVIASSVIKTHGNVAKKGIFDYLQDILSGWSDLMEGKIA